jgi:hypothetical protein
MKKTFLLLGLVILSSCGGAQKSLENVDPTKYSETITPNDLKEHLFIYASDEFEGRNTGEPGQKKSY